MIYKNIVNTWTVVLLTNCVCSTDFVRLKPLIPYYRSPTTVNMLTYSKECLLTIRKDSFLKENCGRFYLNYDTRARIFQLNIRKTSDQHRTPYRRSSGG